MRFFSDWNEDEEKVALNYQKAHFSLVVCRTTSQTSHMSSSPSYQPERFHVQFRYKNLMSEMCLYLNSSSMKSRSMTKPRGKITQPPRVSANVYHEKLFVGQQTESFCRNFRSNVIHLKNFGLANDQTQESLEFINFAQHTLRVSWFSSPENSRILILSARFTTHVSVCTMSISSSAS